ncbi:MAG: prolyl oligopeptidase family serine peptidase [Planctomycetota bacterium]
MKFRNRHVIQGNTFPARGLSAASPFLLLLLVLSCSGLVEHSGQDAPSPLPEARRLDLKEKIHNHWVYDPYRWLEEIETPETRSWIDMQCAHTRSRLDAFPKREAISKRLSELMDGERIRLPRIMGVRFFSTKRKPGQKRSALFVREGSGPARMLIDPDRIDSAGLVSLDWFFPSCDGSLVAYGLSMGGDEWSVLHVMDVATGIDLAHESIPRTRGCSLAWLPNGSGFYYTRYPEPDCVPVGQENYNRHVFFHSLGTDYRDDEKVFGFLRDPRELYTVLVTPDSRYLVVSTFGVVHNQILVQDLATQGAPFLPMTEGIDARSSILRHQGFFYTRTNWQAPNYRILRSREVGPITEWDVVVPEGEHALVGMSLVGDSLFVKRLCHACTAIDRFSLDGRSSRPIALPGIGSASVPVGEEYGTEAYYLYTSFFHGPAIFRYDLVRGESEIHEKTDLPIDPESFETQQVFYRSHDGTTVPMFMVHQKGIEPSGDHPVLLTGYGGFNYCWEPEPLSGLALDFITRGGIWAVANVRGGGEYGRDWHAAGMLENKQNGIDDFKAAAEWLIRNRYTHPGRLAIRGSSNGGLLMGAAMVQAPELFRAVVCENPLLDMVRYHRFSIAGLWVPEYGSPDDPAQFEWLYAYSPYHHIIPGVAYPAIFLITSASDSRVDPMHAMKMAAALQHASSSSLPVLFWRRPNTGHADAALSQQIRDESDIYLFLLDQLGMKWEE